MQFYQGSLFELIKSVIVTFLIISAVFTYFQLSLICSQIVINLKHIQKLEILYEFDVRFHTKVRSPICHVLLDVQNTHRRALIHRQRTNKTKQYLRI